MNIPMHERVSLTQKGEPSYDDIERLAYELWQERGSPQGSPEIDWLKAQRTFQARSAAAGEDPSAR